jgi:hypothetical protein
MKFRYLVGVMTIASVTAYAQQPVSLKETLEWMQNFAADNGRQNVGQRNTDNGRCELGTADCEQRKDVTTFDSQGCSATEKWSVTLAPSLAWVEWLDNETACHAVDLAVRKKIIMVSGQ